MIYKIISRVLTSRLHEVISFVSSSKQSGHIPDRKILDKILLASKLIEGYGRIYVSPRCKIKIDLKKA